MDGRLWNVQPPMDFDRMEAARGANALVVVGLLERTAASKRGPHRGDRRSGCGMVGRVFFFGESRSAKKTRSSQTDEPAIHTRCTLSLYTVQFLYRMLTCVHVHKLGGCHKTKQKRAAMVGFFSPGGTHCFSKKPFVRSCPSDFSWFQRHP